MTSYTFRPATRENVGLLIGLAGASGSGKTYSAMRLAAGIVGEGQRFAVIDTEARRALHYADRFAFDHCELGAPFRPQNYVDAIAAADQAGYRAIVIDSMSHEWAGEGGVLDWQEEELQRMAGDDWKRRENMKMAAWIKPKSQHKKMVQRLLQSRAHLIFCLRAEEKVKMHRGEDGKEKIVPIGWQPVCAKDFPFELTVSFMMKPEQPGIPEPLKLQEQHRPIFPEGAPIDEKAGARLDAWARGEAPPEKPKTSAPRFKLDEESAADARRIAQALGKAKDQRAADQILLAQRAALDRIKAQDEEAHAWLLARSVKEEPAGAAA